MQGGSGTGGVLTPPAALQFAVTAFQRGDWAEAERLCRGVLAAQADHFRALQFLAVIALESGRTQEAIDLLSRACAIDPGSAQVHNNLGVALGRMQRHADALQSYERALDLDPDYAECHYNRGNALRDLGRYADALPSYERAIALAPSAAAAHNEHGSMLQRLGRSADALVSHDRALALQPDFAEAWNNRGVALASLERHAEALSCYDRALALKPDYAEASNNRGVALGWLKRYAEALASFERALAQRPGYAGAYHNRGMVLTGLGQHEEALANDEQALLLKPDFPEAWFSRGNSLAELQRHTEALASFDEAIARAPEYVDAWCNRGNALRDLHRHQEAITSYKCALSLDPEFAGAHWNLANCYLLLGDYLRAWAHFEWRWKAPGKASPRRDFAQPQWDGATSLAGKTLLLHSEQGLGDTLLFCRYAQSAVALGARVVLQVQPSLVSLLAGQFEATEVIADGDTLPAFDLHCSLMSAPGGFKTALHDIPDKIPYLRSDFARVASWRARLGDATRPRVGIAWSGSKTLRRDQRSIGLADLLPILTEDIEWISLQKEVSRADSELLAANVRIRYFGDSLRDFADTAALVEVADLVLTVDTSVAHLAGAMGKAVWVMLPFNPFWVWLLDRQDSPWYPTARAFRQPANGDWTSVAREVRGALEHQWGS